MSAAWLDSFPPESAPAILHVPSSDFESLKMKLFLASFAAAVSLLIAGGTTVARAGDFTFAFTGEQVRANDPNPETVSGELFGLGDNGFYSPTHVVTNGPLYSFYPNDGNSWFTGGFQVSDDMIVSSSFSIASGNPGCFSGCFLTLSNTENAAGFGSGNFVIDRSGHPATFANISAAPEPGAWALMMLGVAGLGAALRFRRRETAAVATA